MSETSYEVSGPNQGRIRLEDLDLNGYPDILVTFLVRERDSGELKYFSTVLMNNQTNPYIEDERTLSDCVRTNNRFCQSYDYRDISE